MSLWWRNGKMADITLEELKRLIEEAVDRRLREQLADFEHDTDLLNEAEPDVRSWEEVKRDIKHHRWTPPPGTPSIVQLLREDRDR
jgi:hypothetical protein